MALLMSIFVVAWLNRKEDWSQLTTWVYVYIQWFIVAAIVIFFTEGGK